MANCEGLAVCQRAFAKSGSAQLANWSLFGCKCPLCCKLPSNVEWEGLMPQALELGVRVSEWLESRPLSAASCNAPFHALLPLKLLQSQRALQTSRALQVSQVMQVLLHVLQQSRLPLLRASQGPQVPKLLQDEKQTLPEWQMLRTV